MSSTGFRRIGNAQLDLPRGQGIYIPRAGYSAGGGGEFGAIITDDLRSFAVTREPVAHRVVFTVAHDIYDNWFELQLEGDETGEKSQQFNKQIQTELIKLKAKRELTLKAVYERAYGWAILVLGYADEAKTLRGQLRNPKALQAIKAYGPPQISRVEKEKDKKNPRYGLPKIYHITRSGLAGNLLVHYTRVIHFATRRTYYYTGTREEWEGLSTLDPIWDDLTTLRNVRWGMGQTMYRYGSGFPDITFTNAELSDIETYISSGAFANLSARTYFIHNQDQQLEFKGTAGKALDPMNYYLPIMENISCGSGIPLAILRGVQAGALTGSEVNQQEYYGIVSDAQSSYEPGIRKLINIIRGLGTPDNVKTAEEPPAFEFEWKSGIELTEAQKSQIALSEAQTWQIQGQWMTRNEIRAAIDPDLEPLLPEQGGDELLGRSTFQPPNGSQNFVVQPNADGTSIVTEIPHHHKR